MHATQTISIPFLRWKPGNTLSLTLKTTDHKINVGDNKLLHVTADDYIFLIYRAHQVNLLDSAHTYTRRQPFMEIKANSLLCFAIK